MRSKAERRLFLLVGAASIGLTVVTVWAVASQGRALEARELADLRNSAATAAARAQAACQADVERGFDRAAQAYESGGPAELDAWATGRSHWLLAASADATGQWMFYPRTPLEEPLPGAPDAAESRPAGQDLLGVLRKLQNLALDPDPLTRAGALLAMAACEQQLGHPLAAANFCAEAAHLLRSTPQLARFAFRAESAHIASLRVAGDLERARDSFANFVNGLLMDHPARLGAREAALVAGEAAALNLRSDVPATAAVAEIQRRAAQREALLAAAARLLQTPHTTTSHSDAGETPGSERLAFLHGATDQGEPLVVARRNAAGGLQLAVIAPLSEILSRYWTSAGDPGQPAGVNGAGGPVAWQVRSPGRAPAQPLLAQLGPEFAGAALEPTPQTAAHLAAARRRQLTMVLATAAGTAGAWLLIVWMMLRAVRQQRELARLQGRFVADVSHELKTPLALIRLLAETLADRRVRDPDRAHAYHETITREAERLSLLLDNILDLGRIESGRKRYEFGACDIADVARQAWTLFEPQFAAEGFEACLEIAPHLPVIRADAQALQQVLVNLLQNAHRYGGDGKFVRLCVAREEHVLLLMVEDHGIGMNRQQLQQLGESFFRAEDARVRQQRGVGLGLAICQHIVTAHGGKIEVHSRPGQGSRFTVWIPLEPAATPAEAVPESRPRGSAT